MGIECAVFTNDFGFGLDVWYEQFGFVCQFWVNPVDGPLPCLRGVPGDAPGPKCLFMFVEIFLEPWILSEIHESSGILERVYYSEAAPLDFFAVDVFGSCKWDLPVILHVQAFHPRYEDRVYARGHAYPDPAPGLLDGG